MAATVKPALAVQTGVSVANRRLVSAVHPYFEDDKTAEDKRDKRHHIVVMSQSTNYNNKIFVVTPAESYFVCASSFGKTKSGYWTLQNIHKFDMPALCAENNAAYAGMTEGSDWKKGEKPVFFSSAAYCPLGAIYDIKKRGSSEDSWDYSGVDSSIALFRFDLNGLPLGKASSFTAYLRAYRPSGIVCYTAGPRYPLENVNSSSLWRDWVSPLDIRFFESKPAPAWAIGETPSNCEQKSLAGTLNNSATASTFTGLPETLIYDPYDSNDGNRLLHSAAHVYGNSSNGGWQEYHHDYELTSGLKDFLMTPRGAFWATVTFPVRNWSYISTETGWSESWCDGMLYAERFALILKVTMNSYG